MTFRNGELENGLGEKTTWIFREWLKKVNVFNTNISEYFCEYVGHLWNQKSRSWKIISCITLSFITWSCITGSCLTWIS